MRKHFLMPVISLLIICLVMSGAVSLANFFTKDKIAELEAEKTRAAISELLPDTARAERDTQVGEYEVYNCYDGGGQLIGKAYNATAKGYGGDIAVLVALSGESKVEGVKILSSSETPGLGKKAENAEFYTQFNGKTVSRFNLTKTGAFADDEIDAVTAATVTSTAVVKTVNEVLQHYRGVSE